MIGRNTARRRFSPAHPFVLALAALAAVALGLILLVAPSPWGDDGLVAHSPSGGGGRLAAPSPSGGGDGLVSPSPWGGDGLVSPDGPTLAGTSWAGEIISGSVSGKAVAAEKRRLLGLAAQESAGPRIMVKMRPGAVDLDRRLDLAALGVRVVRVIEPLGISVVEPLPDAGGSRGAAQGDPSAASGRASRGDPRVDALIDRFRRTPGVSWAAPSTTREFARVPNDPYYEAGSGHIGQWGPPAVGLESVWDYETGSDSVVVAVLDSGIGRDIPDFSGRLVHPYSAEYQTTAWPAWEDTLGHGSGTSGIAAAAGDNLVGIAGASWRAAIMPVHLTDQNQGLSDEAEIDGILWAADHGADIINMSFGSPEPHAGEQAAVEYALSKGAVVVASSGNDGPVGGVWYPAAYNGVIGVGATDISGERASFSSYGDGVDLMAPGVDIVTWGATQDDYLLWVADGTSFAAPLVSGVISLMLAQEPTLTGQEISGILAQSADDLGSPGWDGYTGFGLIDAAQSVRMAAEWRQPTTTSRPTTTTTVPPTTTTTTLPTTSTTLPTTTTTLPPTTTTTEPPPVTFRDVPPGHPYAQAVYALARAGVVQGYATGDFGLADPVTRQQFAKMILLTLGQTPTEFMVSPFVDVPRVVDDLYPDNYVALAYAWGITRGTSLEPLRFSPAANISRAQVTSMVVRGADAIHPGLLVTPPSSYRAPFGEFSPVHDASATRAAYNGLLSGLLGWQSPTYDMWRFATRGEVATVLAALLEAQ